MIFWIICGAMSALVVALLARALTASQTGGAEDAVAYDLKVYRDQLAEVDRDVARGVLGKEDAKRAQTEISRRILAADAAPRATTGTDAAPQRVIALILVIGLIGGSMAIYAALGQPGYGDLALADRIAYAKEVRENRPDQKTAVDSLPPFALETETTEEFRALMERLRETVAARPGDLQGHLLLAQNEARMGNFVAAAEAQEKALRLQGDEMTANDIADYGELLVLAAGGYVSPEAEAAFRAALTRDETDARARYYLGLMMVQTGRPDIAFRLWDALLRRGPEDAAWIAPILAQIQDVSRLAGVDYTIPAIGAGAAPGPSLEDMQAASEMTAEDRMAMIGGMVAGLSDRLATEGGPPQDWARLITSLSVMGDPDQARAIFDNAMEVFAGDAAALDIITAAGSQAGVAE
ncbi:c-type cytochrome biogenesis protein CcmI [Sulfitobacter sp. F26204]|uniref:c-type cytochrome biogenesis protein CcmI n=1 Tax=Sulfitobacter sp. F26204 TaxID=2996014 RepID=UPI00225E26B9|nr:c-type cytochrome biogenesis protein CcmI [Sulfitobacter sp. F26204]MCX7560767.1 c-type cytochrome biogenesis protein CcmI [Sulfitobacter sp. F26204]